MAVTALGWIVMLSASDSVLKILDQYVIKAGHDQNMWVKCSDTCCNLHILLTSPKCLILHLAQEEL